MTPCPYRPTATASIAASLLASIATAKTVPGSSLPSPLPRLTAWAAPRPIHAARLGSAPANLRIDTTNGITMLMVADGGASPLDVAMNNAAKLRTQDVEQITSSYANACAAIVSGSGRRDHWATLCSALNLSLSIERQGVVRGMAGHLSSIEATLLAIAARAGEDDTPPTWRPPQLSLDETDNVRLLVQLSLDETDNVRLLVQLHKFQLEQLSYGEYRRAFEATVNRVRGGGGEAVNLPAEFGPEVTV